MPWSIGVGLEPEVPKIHDVPGAGVERTGKGGIPSVDAWRIKSEYGGARSTPSGLKR